MKSVAKIRPNLAEQSAPAGQQYRDFIRRRHDVKTTARDGQDFGGRIGFGVGGRPLRITTNIASSGPVSETVA
jgi:hypothetical protein